MKNTPGRNNSRLDKAEDRISNFEDKLAIINEEYTGGINSRSNEAEDQISDLMDKGAENTLSEQENGKRIFKK